MGGLHPHQSEMKRDVMKTEVFWNMLIRRHTKLQELKYDLNCYLAQTTQMINEVVVIGEKRYNYRKIPALIKKCQCHAFFYITTSVGALRTYD